MRKRNKYSNRQRRPTRTHKGRWSKKSIKKSNDIRAYKRLEALKKPLKPVYDTELLLAPLVHKSDLFGSYKPEDHPHRYRQFYTEINKSNYVRNHLKKRQNGVCAQTGKTITGRMTLQVHHENYVGFCQSGFVFDNGLPDCERCHKEQPIAFNACISRLSLVSKGGHDEIHKKYEKLALKHLKRYQMMLMQGRSDLACSFIKASINKKQPYNGFWSDGGFTDAVYS